MSAVALAREAMATRFEFLLQGDNPVSLRAAGEEALDEIERIEAQLSLYRSTSEIARLNARAARERVKVEPMVFRLLEHARRLWQETGGYFDITVGPLMRCWGFMGGDGEMPPPEALEAARARVGMTLVDLDPADFTVRFLREGVVLDLGAIGKGYALEQAACLLRDAGVTRALLHGGTSTVVALGIPQEAEAWKVALEYPPSSAVAKRGDVPGAESPPEKPGAGAASAVVAVVPLRDESLSVSTIWGKCFASQGRTLGHVLDPRTGQPAAGACFAAVVLPSATETDALSTALLAGGLENHEAICGLRPGMRALVIEAADEPPGFRYRASGIQVRR